eukprot:9149368-Ditylum_brightwellii.AAC.1
MESIQERDKYCYKFSQPELINNILEATDKTKCNGKPTPIVSKLPVGPELGSKPAEEHFEYLSIIG